MAVTGGAGGDGGGGAAEYEHPCRCGDAYRLTGLDVAAAVAGHEEDDQQRRQGQRQAQLVNGGAGPDEAAQAEILVPCGSCSLHICVASPRSNVHLATVSRSHLAGVLEDCLASTRPPTQPAKWLQAATDNRGVYRAHGHDEDELLYNRLAPSRGQSTAMQTHADPLVQGTSASFVGGWLAEK
eukprot:SM000124S25960  [mRNA]  locus=s124:408374:409236:- [translate_table: standard]